MTRDDWIHARCSGKRGVTINGIEDEGEIFATRKDCISNVAINISGISLRIHANGDSSVNLDDRDAYDALKNNKGFFAVIIPGLDNVLKKLQANIKKVGKWKA